MKKRLVIIGGGPNLARETARRFGREGWHIVLGARNQDRLSSQVADLASAGIDADFLTVDAADFAQTSSFIQSIESRHGPITVLNYNAAVIRNAGILDTAHESVAADLMTNVGGAFFAIQSVLPAMRARGSGAIILSGGGLGIEPWPEYLTLSVGKAGLRALGQAIAKDPALADIHIAHAILHTAITPDAGKQIANLYWSLANEPKGEWRTEVIYPEQH